jgi:general secretion pathway protein D
MRPLPTACFIGLLSSAIAIAGCSAPSPSRPYSAVLRQSAPPARPAPVTEQAITPTVTGTRDVPVARGETEFLAFGSTDTRDPSTPGPAAPALDPEKRIALNLQDVDVRSVIDVVLGETLKVAYTVAPQVQGKVSVRTGQQRVGGNDLLSMLEAALASVSAALVVNGNQFEVLPVDAIPGRVRQAYALRSGERPAPGYAVQFVQIRHASAAELQRVLETVAPKGVVLQADVSLNRIVIAGSSADRLTLTRTIEALDTDALQGMSIALFRLRYASAEQVLAEVRQIYRSNSEFVTGQVRLVPLDRLRAVVGIAPQRSDLERIEGWIRRLDLAPPASERRLYVIPVQHSKARELAETLQLVLTGDGQINTPSTTGAGAGSSVDRSPRPLPGGSAGPTAMPSDAPPSQGGMQLPRGSNLRVVANEDNNSLLLLATDAEQRLVREAMFQLDVPARQVLIEAVIAEVTLGDDLRFGVQWFFDSGRSQSTLSGNAAGAVLSQFPGFSYFRNLSADARFVINALQSQTDVKVISAPRLSVLNNRRAQLMVGDEVPILSQVSQSTVGPGAPLVSSIQMRDTGVMLEVTPRISENGSVVLEVTQEVSDVAQTTTSGIDSPTIQRRRLRSMIATRDGATVALGGLIRENQTKSRSGVPLLKDLPWVGALFRSDTINTKRTELIVLLVPRVMHSEADARLTLDEFMESFKASGDLMRDGIRFPLRIDN